MNIGGSQTQNHTDSAQLPPIDLYDVPHWKFLSQFPFRRDHVCHVRYAMFLLRIGWLLPSLIWCQWLRLIHTWDGRTLHGETCITQIRSRPDSVCFPMDRSTKRKDRPWNEEWNENCCWKGKWILSSYSMLKDENRTWLWISSVLSFNDRRRRGMTKYWWKIGKKEHDGAHT